MYDYIPPMQLGNQLDYFLLVMIDILYRDLVLDSCKLHKYQYGYLKVIICYLPHAQSATAFHFFISKIGSDLGSVSIVIILYI